MYQILSDLIGCISSEATSEMIQTVALIGLIVMMGMVVVWYVAMEWLLRRLRYRHSGIYESIGSPTSLSTGSLSNWLFLRFLFGVNDQTIDDPAVVAVCRFMRGFMILYLFLFACWLYVVFTSDALITLRKST